MLPLAGHCHNHAWPPRTTVTPCHSLHSGWTPGGPMGSVTKGCLEQSHTKVSGPSELLWDSLIAGAAACSVRRKESHWVPGRYGMSSGVPWPQGVCWLQGNVQLWGARWWSGLFCQDASVCACPLSSTSAASCNWPWLKKHVRFGSRLASLRHSSTLLYKTQAYVLLLVLKSHVSSSLQAKVQLTDTRSGCDLCNFSWDPISSTLFILH